MNLFNTIQPKNFAQTGIKIKFLLFFILLTSICLAQTSLTIKLEPGEKVWSGSVKQGDKMPFDVGYTFDFYANNEYNQIQPLLLGNKGLWVWSEEPFAFEVQSNQILITRNLGEVKYGRSGQTLAEARRFTSSTFFPASGEMPDELLFSSPQYNTWIELTYNQNQADVLKYAQAIIDNGFEPGVLMIDDTWQEDYGKWDFHPGRFPSPRAMIERLQLMGFKVMLWMCPFVSGDQALTVRELMKEKAFLMQKRHPNDTWETSNTPAVIPWWNGYSLLLDFTNPSAVNWFNSQLDRLVRDYGIDGFKLDAGDMNFYPSDALSKEVASPNYHSELYAQFGLRFPLNEYRACWKMAGLPIAQRLHDKLHQWSDVQKLMPHMLNSGLIGYTFSCPDMIGGGEYKSFIDNPEMDQELVVRSAQIHALMPMMQFSVAPWRILDKQHLNAVKKAVEIRKRFTPKILELARKSAITGEPIINYLEYCYPGQGYEHVNDQFMLGTDLLVAPVVEKSKTQRNVILPEGKWLADDGKIYRGGKNYIIEVPLDRIPYFELQK